MIVSFKCKQTEELWVTGKCKRFPPEALKAALRKLLMVHSATELKDLRIPPSNHLENLLGDRKEQYSIRINQKWRLCFVWKNKKAHEVEIVDYH